MLTAAADSSPSPVSFANSISSDSAAAHTADASSLHASTSAPPALSTHADSRSAVAAVAARGLGADVAGCASEEEDAKGGGGKVPAAGNK